MVSAEIINIVNAMNDSKKPIAKITTGHVVQTTGEHSSLIARGLEAVKHSHLLITETDPDKLFRQGMRYRNGSDGVQQDYDRACQYFLAAANLDYADAQSNLGIMY